jgi:uncharacterized protein
VGYHGTVMADPYRCPICRKPVVPGARAFPFCSDRCKLIDLGSWASERYRISRPIQGGEPDPEAGGEVLPSSGDSEEGRG